MSFAMMVFTPAPALAPTLSAAAMMLAGQPAIFAVLLIFAIAVSVWCGLGQPENCRQGDRRDRTLSDLGDRLRQVL